jgi:hypothetical protein
MADRGNYDRAVRPILVFNGTMTGLTKKGGDGDFYAVWRACLVINLGAKSLLFIITGNDDDDDSDNEEIQPSVQRRQAHAAHIVRSTLVTSPFLFVQGVSNDPAAILRIVDSKCQGTDTSSVMSAVTEFTTKKYRSSQHMGKIVVEFEGLAMSPEAIGQGVSEQMRVVNFLNCCLSSRPYLPSCRRFVSQTTLAGPRRRRRFCSSQNWRASTTMARSAQSAP